MNKIIIQDGFTLPELAASMTLMSIVILSVLYITGEASYFFNREIMREEIQHYGNTILDDISDQISSAPEVNLSFTHNSRKISCVFDDINGDDSITYVYTGDRYQGILKDGEPIEILRFNNSKISPYKLELIEFDCNSAFDVSEPATEDLRNSFLDIELIIDALYTKNDKELRQRFEFTRRIFARSKFANA